MGPCDSFRKWTRGLVLGDRSGEYIFSHDDFFPDHHAGGDGSENNHDSYDDDSDYDCHDDCDVCDDCDDCVLEQECSWPAMKQEGWVFS